MFVVAFYIVCLLFQSDSNQVLSGIQFHPF